MMGWPITALRRLCTALAAGALATGAALLPAFAQSDTVDVKVRIPGESAIEGPRDITDAVLAWAVNPESGSGAFFGGCNFLSAGKAGNAGGSKVWAAGNPHYRAKEGAVTVQKPVLEGGNTVWREAAWDTRCIDQSEGRSRTVTTSGTDYGTGNRVSVTGGTGVIDAEKGTATIAWKGSFSVVYYGGMTYWWATDPKLTVKDGKGTLTATGGGYGASMEDMSRWEPLREREITLANLPSVSLTGKSGMRIEPSYRNVAVAAPAGNQEQSRTGTDWGSFPQNFVNFQADVGQAGYWYSTGGQRDFAKPPYPLYISYSATDRVDAEPPTNADRGGGVSSLGGNGSGSGSSSSPSGGDGSEVPGSGSSSGGQDSASGPGGSSGSSDGRGAASGPGGSSAAQQADAPPADEQQAFPATLPELVVAAKRFIPAAAAAVEDPRARFAVASSALAIVSMACYVGFRRGWLALPWIKR